MKKFFVFILLAFCSVCAVLVGCAPDNYRGLKFGKYYLENSDDIYIEIKADHRPYLHILVFSDFNPEEYWGNMNEWELLQLSKNEVIDWMQGERNYWYFNNEKLLSFQIDKSYYAIEFDYNGTNELKSNYNGDVYILRK